ncbi:MAG: hypothetical protein HY718_06840, partial [Planctomycetes bacterium]|nr:hypothetical protein [Planctomycetota bacterium]
SGIAIDDVVIGDDGAGARHPLMRVGRIGCDLSPLGLMTDRKLRELNFTDPEVWIEFDEAGRLNLAWLANRRGGRLPSFNYRVTGLTCHVITPQVSQTFRIDGLDVQLDPQTGLLHLASATRVARPEADPDEPKEGRLDFDANVRIPRLKKTEQLNGDIRVEWSDLALSDLPVPLISRVPVEQVDGITSGRLAFKTHPDLGVDYTLAISLAGVRIMRPDVQRPAQVPDADLYCAGHWDPNGGVVEMKELRYETPAVRVEAAASRGPALRYDEGGETAFEFHLAGGVKDWQALRQEVPELDQAVRRVRADLRGEATFTADAVRRRHEDHLAISVDGRGSQWTIGGATQDYLTAPADLPKQVVLAAVRDRATGRVGLPAFAVTLGDWMVEGRGEVTLPSPVTGGPLEIGHLLEAVPSLRGEAKARCRNLATLPRLLPWLVEQAELKDLSGPAEVAAAIDTEGRCSRLHATASLPAESSLSVGEVISKREGPPLDLSAQVRLPYAGRGRLRAVSVTLLCGQAKVDLESVQGGLEYRTEFRDDGGSRPRLASADADWDFELRARQVADLVAMSPLVERLRAQAGVGEVAGDVEVRGRISASYRPGDSMVRIAGGITADGLGARVGELVSKQRGEPLRIDFGHTIRATTSHREHELRASAVRPSGRISVGLLRADAGADQPAGRVSRLSVDAQLDDAADWLGLVPAARWVAEKWHVSGEAWLKLQDLRVGGWHAGQLHLDATRARVAAAEGPGFGKPAGTPTTARLAWRAEVSPDRPEGETWHLTEGQLRLGGAKVDRLEAQLAIAAAAGDALADGKMPYVSHLELSGSGAVSAEDDLGSLHPALAEWIDRLRTEGVATWRLGLKMDDDRIRFDGHVDAEGVAATLDLPNDLVPSVRKSAGEPLSASVTLSIPRQQDGASTPLAVERAELHVAGNVVRGRGEVSLPPHGKPGTTGAVPFSLAVQAQLPRANRLLAMLPKAPLETLAGELTANVTVQRNDGPPRIAGARVQFQGFQMGVTPRPLHLDGVVVLDGDRLSAERLDWSWRRSSGTISGDLALRERRYEANLGVAGRQVFIEELRAETDALLARVWPDDDQSPDHPLATAVATAADGDQRRTRAIIDLLRRSQARIDVGVGTLVTLLPLDIQAVADAVSQRLEVRDGVVRLEFGCLMDGGQVSGEVTADLNAADPSYRLTYTADRLQPGSVVNSYLRRTFPGMEATGPLTLIDESVQKLLPAPGELNHETGEGQLIIDGGMVMGRAAPVWVTRIFPGLDLATFDFTRMHSWFRKTLEGRVHHQMIYQGGYYNVYMIGHSDADHTFRYEVGLDFLAGLESEYWANSGQGRVPLFTKTGRVLEDGTIENEVVSFVSLQRVVETLFVRNNPLVTAYHAVRKRVLGQQ